MPTPDTTGAQKHREETDGGTVEVEAEATTGGDDPDGDDGEPPEGPPEQTHGGDDDDGSLGVGILGDRRVIAAVVIISIVLVYFMYRGAQVEASGGGTGNRQSGGSHQAPDDDDDEWNVPMRRDDPLAADEYVLHETGVFPSISFDGDSGGPVTGVN
jgi:hypothetical protein